MNETFLYNNTAFSSCPSWFPYHLVDPSTLSNNNTLDMECPDTILVPITSGILYGSYLILFLICLIFLIWKRKASTIKARSPVILSFGLVANFTLVSLALIRCIVGKTDFPCFLFSIFYFILGPCFVVPSIIRGIELIIQYKVNLLRAKSISRCNLSNNYSTQVQDVKSDVVSEKTETQSECGTSYKETRSVRVLTTLNRILQSAIFHLCFTLFLLIFHLGIWLCSGLIEDGFYSKHRFFMTNASILSVGGCYSSTGSSIAMAVFVGLYFIIDLIINIICLTIDNDTFNIKIGNLGMTVVRILCGIFYLVFSQVPVLRSTGRIIPSIYVFILNCIVELIVTILIPSIKDCIDKMKYQSKYNQSEIECVLNDQKLFNILIDFSRRSYSPESVLFYKDIQHYKQLVAKLEMMENGAFQHVESIKNLRVKITRFVQNIVHVYLCEGSVNELNIPNLKMKKLELTNKIAACIEFESNRFTRDLFDSILVESMLTLMEVYHRLKQQNPTIRQFSLHWKNDQDKLNNSL
ncbi:predicted protein [Naegleria gruberi]|uniref:Predicted protein n=1 Tax=Naegleria gruberi TaxID=5762 RepID=D2W0C7_NAEGR|nr:uncharacterized protein NAEGRDRAFT_74812 [Naegleria gruberi]EFC37410.1 predicted protein [Naegleria gruberi]|eukprot:XP_002670154.1 predicted protein [Naegleria gruberi strain NEG-M]